jgi:hypothetical protein
MSLIDKIQSRIASDTDAWRRHANRWSVWTRLAMVPAFAATVYFRAWLGWWTVVLLGILGLWTWLNVKVFAKEEADRTWEARAIFGEKFWLERSQREIPAHHLRAVLRLNLASAAMVLPMAWGLRVLDPWATAFGTIGGVAGQLWALDRYSWLYEDVTRGLVASQRMAMVDGAPAPAGEGGSRAT